MPGHEDNMRYQVHVYGQLAFVQSTLARDKM